MGFSLSQFTSNRENNQWEDITITMLPYPALLLGSRSWTPDHIDGSEQLSYVDIWFHRAALVRYKFTAHQNSSILLRNFFCLKMEGLKPTNT